MFTLRHKCASRLRSSDKRACIMKLKTFLEFKPMLHQKHCCHLSLRNEAKLWTISLSHYDSFLLVFSNTDASLFCKAKSKESKEIDQLRGYSVLICKQF